MMKALKVFFLLGFISAILFPNYSFADDQQNSTSSRLPTKNLFAASPKVEVVADTLEYQRSDKKVIAKNNVVITYQNIKLTADYAEVETDAKKAYARGHVIVFRNDKATARGEEVYYDFGNDTGSFPDGKTISFPWYGTGQDIEQVRKGVSLVRKGSITTCNLEKPHYDIRAKKITIYSEDKIVAWNVTIYVLGKPVFWWPYLVLPMRDNDFPFNVSAGYNSKFGAFIQVTKGISITKNISGKLLADWRSKRGFGGGAVAEYDFGDYAKGSIIGYWTQDERAPTPNAKRPPGSPPGTKPNPYSQLEERDRGRITWRHRTDFDPYTNIILRYNRLADEYFLQDFFEKEHRAEVEPQSFVTFTKNSESFGFFATAQKRMNNFEALVERLPQLQFDWKNQPFFVPWLYYENQSSFANFSKKYGRIDVNEDVLRYDTFHEWALPLKWRQIKFTPYANLRGTYYSREKDTSNEVLRFASGYGADLRTQFYRTWNVEADPAGIEMNGLRHIFEPSIQVNSIHPSTVSNEELGHFDPIDTIDDKDVITFGLENRLQTKRVINGRVQRVDIVSLNTFINYDVNPDGIGPTSNKSTSSSFKYLDQEVILRPYQWLQFQARFHYDLEESHFRDFNQDLIVRLRRFKFLIGHRYIKDAILIAGPDSGITGVETSHQFVFNARYAINALWDIGGYVRWDADKNDLEEWQISASRDLHDFILDFGYNVRNSEIDSSNKELFFNFRMKAFPEYALRAGGSKASFSDPRIGDTVSGSNQLGPHYDPLNQYNRGFEHDPYARA